MDDDERYINLLLESLLGEYEYIVEHAISWHELGDSEQLSYEFEEPLREQHIDELREYRTKGQLTLDQVQRLEQLEQFIVEHHDTIDRLVYPWKYARATASSN